MLWDLICMKLPDVLVAHLEGIGLRAAHLEPLLGLWIQHSLVGHVPFLAALRCFDLCLVLGHKALYRFVCAIVVSTATLLQRAERPEAFD